MTGDLLQTSRFLQPLRTLFADDVTDWFVDFDKMMEDLSTKWDKSFESFADAPKSTIKDSGDGKYSIDIAVPGFTKDHLTIEVIGDELVDEGKVDEKSEAKETSEEHHRSFCQRFILGDSMKVETAKFADGTLHIDVSTTPKAVPPATKIAIE